MRIKEMSSDYKLTMNHCVIQLLYFLYSVRIPLKNLSTFTNATNLFIHNLIAI